MTIFSFGLTWDTVTILQSAGEFLADKKWEIQNSFGYADTGESALFLQALKKKFVLVMSLENEAKQITLKGGVHGKYLPEGKQIPQYTKVFSSNQVQEASEYFEQIVMEMDKQC